MARSYSTKRAKPIPAEFESTFVRFGWEKCNQVFGKRETLRYYRALGGERLSEKRQAVIRAGATARMNYVMGRTNRRNTGAVALDLPAE